MCVCVWCVLVCGVCVCVGVCVVKERLEVLVCEGWCVCVCVLRCSSRFPSASSRLPVLTTVAMSLTTGTGESSARTSMSSLQRQFWRQPTTSGCYSGEGTAHHPSVSLYHRSLCVCVCCAVSPDCPPLTVCVLCCVSRLSTTHCVCVCAVSPDCPPLTVCVCVLCLQTVHHSLCVLCCVSRLSTTQLCVCCAVSPDCPPLTVCVCAVLCLQTVHLAALLHPQGWAVAVLQGLHRPAAGHGPP